MRWRFATARDAQRLAELNHQLIADEGHRNPMSVDQLRARMIGWIAAAYRAVLFERDGETVAYALFCDDEQGRVHLRQFFVVRAFRRAGIGREALGIFRAEVAPSRPIVLDVLASNAVGRAFWRANGFRDYAFTMELEAFERDGRAPG